jgi:LysR family glycine cleavage system transcriptional activator
VSQRSPRKLPPLNALRAFEAAARSLSFTRAAAELHVTQAAISHQVRALEAELGLPLFVRLHRALRLTPQGARYLPALRDAFDRIDAATRSLAPRRARRQLAISVVPSFGTRWLVPRLGDFRARHPRLDLTLHASSQLVDLAREPFDVAIRFGPGAWPGLRADLLLDEEIVCVASPALARGRRPLARPADLRRHVLLHDESHEPWRTWLEAAGVRGVDAERGIVFSDSAQIVQAAVAGQGVALARRRLAEADLRARRLLRLFADRARSRTDFAYYVVSLAARADEPAIAAFRRWALAQAKRRRR